MLQASGFAMWTLLFGARAPEFRGLVFIAEGRQFCRNFGNAPNPRQMAPRGAISLTILWKFGC
jgi:hypothetical protein